MDVLAALAEQLRAHGGTLHQGHRVRSVSKGGRPTVRLEGGETLTADHLVLATGTPILDRGLHFARLEPQRSYVLALDGAGPMEGMYLSAGSDARSVRDAPGGTLVVGGAGHVVGRTDSHLAHLERAAGVGGEVVPRHHRDPPLVGPGLQQPRRRAVRRTAAAGRRPDPRRHRLREVGHDQRGRGRPRHLLGHPRRHAVVGADPQRPAAVGLRRRRDRPHQPRRRRRGRHRSRAHRPRAAARQRRTGPGQPVRHRRRLHPPRRSAEVERRRGDVGLPAARLPLLARRRGARRSRDPAAPQGASGWRRPGRRRGLPRPRARRRGRRPGRAGRPPARRWPRPRRRPGPRRRRRARDRCG